MLRPDGSKGATRREIAARSLGLRHLHTNLQRRLVEGLKRQFTGQHISREAVIDLYQVAVELMRKCPNSGPP